LASTDQALDKNRAAIGRGESGQRWFETGEKIMESWAWTMHLTELDGLVQKSGLVEFTDRGRVTLYGAMLDLAVRAQGDDGEIVLALRKRLGNGPLTLKQKPPKKTKAGRVDPPRRRCSPFFS
jgi:Conjugal transfer protein TraD